MPVSHVLKGLLVGAAALTLAVTGVTTASAAPPDLVKSGLYAAVGDSFAAGVGNPTLPGAGASLRSADAYPVLLAGKATEVTFLAASGATTATVLAQQVPYVPGGARQITVTVGGNDFGFVSLAIGCAGGLSTPACAKAQQAAEAGQLTLPVNLTAVITALHAQAPAAHIYVTGYPLLFQPQMTSSGPSCPLLPSYDATALAAADQITATLNSVIKGVVYRFDSTGSVVTYVAVTGGDAFGGHGLCDGAASYIFPPTFAPVTSVPMPSSLHPTPAGQMAYAEAIVDVGFRTAAPAPTEVKAASMNLTYMTGCAPDTTNTWRIRNGSTFDVPFTLEYVGQSMLIRPPNGAPVGDSFLETPRQDATAILRWGGGDSGIIAGSVTKASGNDEVSATCAGDKPADKVITKDVGAPDCGVTTVKTEITTITSALEGNKWIEQAPVITYGTRTLTSEEMVLFQNTNPGGACYKAPPTKDATTVVTTAKWACNDKTAVTSSVTTAYSFAFDSKTGTYGPAIPKAGAPVAGVRNLTATEFVACPVTEIVPAAPQNVLASTGADVTPWGVGAGLLALLTGAGLLIARKKA